VLLLSVLLLLLFVLFVAIAAVCNKFFSALTRFLRSQKKKNNASIEITTTGTATATPTIPGLTPVVCCGQSLAIVVEVTVAIGTAEEEFELNVCAAFPVIFVKVTFDGVRVKFPFAQSDVSGLQVNNFPPGVTLSKTFWQRDITWKKFRIPVSES
jgi:hypothetical protein